MMPCLTMGLMINAYRHIPVEETVIVTTTAMIVDIITAVDAITTVDATTIMIADVNTTTQIAKVAAAAMTSTLHLIATNSLGHNHNRPLSNSILLTAPSANRM